MFNNGKRHEKGIYCGTFDLPPRGNPNISPWVDYTFRNSRRAGPDDWTWAEFGLLFFGPSPLSDSSICRSFEIIFGRGSRNSIRSLRSESDQILFGGFCTKFGHSLPLKLFHFPPEKSLISAFDSFPDSRIENVHRRSTYEELLNMKPESFFLNSRT